MINVREHSKQTRHKQKTISPQNAGPSGQARGRLFEAACHILRRPGGLSEEPEPDPIPNSAVKLLSADGTVSQDPGE